MKIFPSNFKTFYQLKKILYEQNFFKHFQKKIITKIFLNCYNLYTVFCNKAVLVMKKN